MRHVESLIILALALVAAAAGLYISAMNRDVVTIDLLFWPAVSLRAGLLVVAAFAVGAIAGMAVSVLGGALRGARRRAAGGMPRRGEAR